MGLIRLAAWMFCLALAWALPVPAVFAAPTPNVTVATQDEGLASDVRTASLLLTTLEEGQTEPRELVSAALADYRRIVETLYAYGHYSGVVSIKLNGQEAANMSLLSLPAEISAIDIAVDPGPPFVFGTARVAPVAPGTELPKSFAPGEPALATVIRRASQTSISSWRDAGYAKAETGRSRIVANHPEQTLDAEVEILPGPQVTFGNLVLSGESAVRRTAMTRIAAFPSGEQFSPEALTDVTQRLRRTGTFSSVSVTEGDVNPDGSMDVEIAVVDRKPRRFGFGAEIATDEGINITGFWLHRNIFGGAERLRFDAEIANIGADNNGVDYKLGARLEFPAVWWADTYNFIGARLERIDDPQFSSDLFEVGCGIVWLPDDGIEAEIALAFHRSNTTDSFGNRSFRFFLLPGMITWDRRDEPLDATSGTYLRARATPYLGFSGTASGVRLYGDARGYRSFNNGRIVLAGRLQLGSILGSELDETYPDFLFYSGGGDTVRGQPYQSLGVKLSNGLTAGGRGFAGTMLEVRARFTDTLGGVLFTDAGFLSSDSLGGDGEWHAGAGIGVRYATPIGPLRFDVAFPVEGDTGDGVQIYIGIGQAF